MNIATDTFGFLCIAATDAVVSTGAQAAESWLQLVERFGIMACILLYFLYRDYLKSREEKQQRLHDQAYRERIETYVRDTLVTELQQNRASITKSTLLMKRVIQSVSHCPGFVGSVSDSDSDLHPVDQTTPLDGVENVQKQPPPSDGTAL